MDRKEGKLIFNDNNRYELNGREFCSGDKIEILVNGVWQSTTIEYYEGYGGYYAVGFEDLLLSGRYARIPECPGRYFW